MPSLTATHSSTTSGLSLAEADLRLANVGPNELSRSRSRRLTSIIVDALREPMFALLLAASMIYLALGDRGEGLFLFGGACVAVGLVVGQEARSERAMERLRELGQPFARVVRGGEERRIAARSLVPGDRLLVGEGERIPADARLTDGEVLSVDESMLTGESVPVTRQPGDGSPAEIPTPGGDGGPFIFAGTLVTRGQGAAVVLQTGAGTLLGGIGRSLETLSEQRTPLQQSAARIVGWLGAGAIVFCGLIAVLYGVLRSDWMGGLLAGITVAIALIPEEFPMVLAVFMAFGAWRLAARNVLVRRAAATEALGGVTVLCIDKTGTLTRNRMQVASLWVDGREEQVTAEAGLSSAAAELVRAAALASAPITSDPIDLAVRALCQQRCADDLPGADANLKAWPLSRERLASTLLWRDGTRCVVAAKGAPEAIFRLCKLSEERSQELHDLAGTLGERGLRVLGVAAAEVGAVVPDQPEDAGLAFLGFVAFADPLRPEAPPAIAEARRAGISVCMITGDYPMTAMAIAREAGIDVTAGVLTGDEIARLAPGELAERIAQARVFARIHPEQKLTLVEAFKANGEIVAMTGDGVNDAPALEAAHIGIAMGLHGTDVAREAADLVLLDDRLGSIIGGVRLGRRIFANLRRALTFVTAIHVPVAGLALAPLLMGLPPLLLPMHIVLLELVIDPVCSLVFEPVPSESGAMTQPPRPRTEVLFGLREVTWALVQGAIVFAAVLACYLLSLHSGTSAQARGASLVALILANLTLALTTSATDDNLFGRHRAAFWGIAAAAILAVCALFFVPVLAGVFHVTPPGPRDLLMAAALGVFGGTWWLPFRSLIKGRSRHSRGGGHQRRTSRANQLADASVDNEGT
jgi:Ca2+-transporting ATPase